MKEEMKTAEEILDKAIPNYRDGYKVGPSHKEDHIYNAILKAMEEYAEQARREEREKSFEMLEMLQKWAILNEEHYRDVSDLIQKTREIIEKTTTIQVMTQKQRERKLSEEDRKLIRRAMGLY